MVEDVTRDGKFVIPSIDSLTEAGAKLSRPCSAGTLTIVCSGTVGVPSILAVDACIHDGFLALTKVSKKIRIDYLYHFFSTQRDKFNNSATHGGVFTNLTTKGVREFLVALPVSIEEQTAITTILSDMDEELQVLEQRLNKTRQIKQGMMQELLTGKTRLPFEVNDQQGLGL
jgi:type I restriction enzyme S subunit